MLSRRRFVAAGMLAMVGLAGGCAIGGGYEPGPEMDFTIKNLTGSPVVLRFDRGLQSSTGPELIERVKGADIQVASGQTMGYNPAPSETRAMRRDAQERSAMLVWQVQVRQFGASWEEPGIRWFEVRDTTPVELTLVTGIEDETGERVVQMRAKGGTVMPIPREHWPEASSD